MSSNNDISELAEEYPAAPADTQPFANVQSRNSRRWVPATWDAAGTGSGHPKLSGGFEEDTRTGAAAPRGYNRPDQRYTQAEAVLQANRATRATAELASSVILQGAAGLFEVRTASGNNYDIAADQLSCSCPDHLRLFESGKLTVECKHRQMVALAIAAVGGAANLSWSADKMAEASGLSVTLIRRACQKGLIAATKVHNVWVIGGAELSVIQTLYTYVFPIMQSVSPSSAVVGSGSTPITVVGSNFCMFSRLVWSSGTVIGTSFVDVNTLTATIPALFLTSPGNFNIRVENAFPGGGTSEPLLFSVV